MTKIPAGARRLRVGLGGLVGLATLLALAPGCGSNCRDDGFAWTQQKGECAAASATESATESASGTETGNVSISVTESESASVSATDTDSGGSESATDSTATDTETGTESGMVGEFCKDDDMDGQGDPDDCIPADGMDAPPGYVPNNLDCDDDDAATFVGSAELDDPDACMTDKDNDGYGDPDPAPGVVPGNDCDDNNAFAFPGAAELDDPMACMEDEDDDGYGDVEPGPGIEPGSDCVDSDPNTYPGAAELDDPESCSTDEDGDGYGDIDPPMGSTPGTDCDDNDIFTFPGAAPNDDPDACMTDEDGDDYGDVDVGEGVVPGTDCDDQTDTTFPGSAPNDDPTACMADADDDDYGDDNPQVPGVVPGTDCNDSEVNVHENCADCEPDQKFCIEQELHLCNMTGTGSKFEELCEFGCDNANGVCLEELSVDAGESLCIDPGQMAQLEGVALGGDGNYSWDWTPADSLSDPNIANPVATPPNATTYEVTVTDGLNATASDNVSIFIKDTPLVLSDQECKITNFEWGGGPQVNWNWNPNLVELCETVNSTPTARFCGWSLDNANLRGRFQIKTSSDDDYVGFLWGIQPFNQEIEEPSQFYFMGWKQGNQLGVFCPGFPAAGAAGIQVHRIDVKDPMNNPLSCEDFHNPLDTPNSKVLANEAEFTTQGWLDNVAYIFDLTHTPKGFTVKVIREDNNQVVAEKEFIDDTFPNGQVGFYAYSQQSACFSNFVTDCL